MEKVTIVWRRSAQRRPIERVERNAFSMRRHITPAAPGAAVTVLEDLDRVALLCKSFCRRCVIFSLHIEFPAIVSAMDEWMGIYGCLSIRQSIMSVAAG